MAPKHSTPRLLYCSTVSGVDQPDSAKGDIVYYGFVFRYSKEAFLRMGDEENTEAEETINDEMNAVMEYIATLPEGCPVGKMMERYEVRDVETDGMIAMWRIPVHTNTTVPLHGETVEQPADGDTFEQWVKEHVPEVTMKRVPLELIATLMRGGDEDEPPWAIVGDNSGPLMAYTADADDLPPELDFDALAKIASAWPWSTRDALARFVSHAMHDAGITNRAQRLFVQERLAQLFGEL